MDVFYYKNEWVALEVEREFNLTSTFLYFNIKLGLQTKGRTVRKSKKTETTEASYRKALEKILRDYRREVCALARKALRAGVPVKVLVSKSGDYSVIQCAWNCISTQRTPRDLLHAGLESDGVSVWELGIRASDIFEC